MLTRSRGQKRSAALIQISSKRCRYYYDGILFKSILVWRTKFLVENVAAFRIAKKWMLYKWKRPNNEQEPCTMETVKGKQPEDGGAWFDLIPNPGHMYRYSANALYMYLMSTKDVLEPLQRYPMNSIELRRLDNSIDSHIKRQYKDRSAVSLLNSRAEREQRHLQNELAFFLEDDIRTLLNALTRAVTNTEVRWVENNQSRRDNDGDNDDSSDTDLSDSDNAEMRTLTISVLPPSQTGAAPRVPEIPYIASLDMRNSLRRVLRAHWAIDRIVSQLGELFRALVRCCRATAVAFYGSFIEANANHITAIMAIFDANLSLEFQMDIGEIHSCIND